MPQSYPIRIGRRSRLVVRLWGATQATAYVELGDDVDIRFGFFRLRFPLAAVVHWRIEGPWVWVKAIGVRRSVRGGDVSFAGDARGGVRLDFRAPVRFGPLRPPFVWVGVEDLEGFAAELTRRGVPGEDGRRGRSIAPASHRS